MNHNHGSPGKQDKGAQHAGTVATEHPGPAGKEGRHEVGNAASSRLHPPHVTENDQGAPVQEDIQNPNDAATLPANAQGHDRVSTTEAAQPIDPTSMYDRRPSEDKDWDPEDGNP